MDQTTPLLGLLADLLARFDVVTVVAQPMGDDFPDTVPANYWQDSDKETSDE